MGSLRRYRRPLAIVVLATLLDLAGRVGFGFDMGRVVAAEAALFLAAGILLGWAGAGPDASDPGVRRLDLWLAACFLLAALRAALWTAGLGVHMANLAVLLVAAAGGVAFLLLRRRRSRPEAHGD
jgi:hypothetical protein